MPYRFAEQIYYANPTNGDPTPTPTPGTFTPLDLVPAPVGWFNSRDAGSITLVSGTDVDAWEAQPPPYTNAGLGTPSARPVYTGVTINSIQALQYNSQQFDIDNKLQFDNQPGMTIAVITDGASSGQILFNGANPAFSTNTRRRLDFITGGTVLRFGGRRLDSDASTNYITTPVVASAINIIVGVYDFVNTTITLYLNGVQVAQNTSFQTAGNSDPSSSFFSQIARSYVGKTGDIILLNYAANLTQIQQMEGYLAHEFNVNTTNLPTSHPYRNFAP